MLLFAAGPDAQERRAKETFHIRMSVMCIFTITRYEYQLVQNKYFADSMTHEIHENLNPSKIHTHTVYGSTYVAVVLNSKNKFIVAKLTVWVWCGVALMNRQIVYVFTDAC